MENKSGNSASSRTGRNLEHEGTDKWFDQKCNLFHTEK